MGETNIYQKIKEATKVIQNFDSQKAYHPPEIGLILGSGLGIIADEVIERTVIPYTKIPYFYGTTVEGHAGQLILGLFHGVRIGILQGRFHLYEGYSMEDVVFPTRTICGLGVQTLVLTNAAGGVNTKFRPGDMMLIEDHLNLMGDNPLKGPHLAQLGPRFPDLSEAYHPHSLKVMRETATELDIPFHQGVYAGLLGPTYETPSEIRMYRTLGADAVGMSTVPESIAANHLGVRVAGLSCITNLAAGLATSRLTHQEVLENSKIGVDKMLRLLRIAIPRLVHRPKN